jgi:hypothetical protein
LLAEVAPASVEGMLTGSDQKAVAFTAALVKPGGCGGVFRADVIHNEELLVAGWVRDADGATVGFMSQQNAKTGKTLKGLPKDSTLARARCIRV